MLQHAAQFAEHGIPFVFDPGQGLPMFSGEELRWSIDRATYVAVNDYEGKMLSDRTQLSLPEVARKVARSSSRTAPPAPRYMSTAG